MIFNDATIRIFDDANILNNMLLNSESYHYYRKYSCEMQNNNEVEQLKKTFLNLKEKYDEVMRFGRYHPDYQSVMIETRRAKKNFEMHPLVAETKKYETALQQLLDDVIVIITNEISSEIKVERGNPFFESSCSGGCSCS